jgi:hypothetical protein
MMAANRASSSSYEVRMRARMDGSTERMYLAEKTVKNYVSSILAKLGLERRTQAAVFAAKLLGR